MADIVKVSWSGGKDSSCAEMLHILDGHKTKVVNYTPMLTKDIPLITKAHYEHIRGVAEFYKSLGAEIFFAEGRTYYDFVLHKCAKGPRKGKINGFPVFISRMCHFREYSKIYAIQHTDVGCFDYEDIGIAYDEIDRQAQLNNQLRSILVEKKITEADAMNICLQHNILSPLYNEIRRDGCVLCPNASKEERERWFCDYPEAREVVAYLQDRVIQEYQEDISRRYPLRNMQWFIEPKGAWI